LAGRDSTFSDPAAAATQRAIVEERTVPSLALGPVIQTVLRQQSSGGADDDARLVEAGALDRGELVVGQEPEHDHGVGLGHRGPRGALIPSHVRQVSAPAGSSAIDLFAVV
jgi:hypothetical protein